MGVASDMYEGGGAKPVKWSEVGQVIEGEIVNIRSKQLTTFGTDRPETWPNGDPKMTPIVTVQTTLEESDDDDGLRDLYLRGGQYTAFGSALREAYTTKPEDGDLVGATLKMQFASTAPSKYGTPRKLFKARVTPKPTSVAAGAWDDKGSEDIPF